MMKDLIPLYIFLALAVFALLVLKDKFNPQKRGVQKYTKNMLKDYRLAKSVMNPAEQRLFMELRKRFNDDILVIVKPRLGDIIEVSRSVRDWKKSRALRNRVSSRHVDFALIRRDGTPLACIELDGKDHGKASVRCADKFKNDICKQIGLMMVRVPAAANYSKAVREIDTGSL